MSRRLGKELDGGLVRLLSGAPRPEASGDARDAILLLTLDEKGRPHPSLLSHGEILATGTRRLRIALRPRSGTAANLLGRRALTVCLVDQGRVVYVKASADSVPRAVPGHPELAAFDATVDDVLVDEPDGSEPAVTRVRGYTFAPASPEDADRRGEGLRAALREAG